MMLPRILQTSLDRLRDAVRRLDSLNRRHVDTAIRFNLDEIERVTAPAAEWLQARDIFLQRFIALDHAVDTGGRVYSCRGEALAAIDVLAAKLLGVPSSPGARDIGIGW